MILNYIRNLESEEIQSRYSNNPLTSLIKLLLLITQIVFCALRVPTEVIQRDLCPVELHGMDTTCHACPSQSNSTLAQVTMDSNIRNSDHGILVDIRKVCS